MKELTARPAAELTVAEVNNPNTATRLTLIRDCLNMLHQHGIIYCHWKSNEHLAASMTGDTDLDILFYDKQKRELEPLLLQLGFKKFCSIKQKQYRDIEDYIGLDDESGKVIHIHAHFKLTMGEMYLKGYQLDLEEQILSSRVYDCTYEIYTSSPAFELVLLYFREALKIRNRDILMMRLRKKRMNYGGNVLCEYNWLRERVTNEQLEAILKSLFSNHTRIYTLMTGAFNRRQLQELSAILKHEFRLQRLFTPLQAFWLRHYREAVVRISRKLSQVAPFPVPSQRIYPSKGISVAVVGADGSGKSTVTANLEKTFRQKLDVYRLYFGRGDGKKSWLIQIYYFIKTILKPSKYKAQQRISTKNSTVRKRGLVAEFFKCIEALLVANEKRRNLSLMQVAKNKGMLVICDRFPQNKTMGYNDGPLLHHLLRSGNPVFRALAKIEHKVYAHAEQNPPDLLIKLIADAEVVEARKPGETSLDMLKTKISGIKDLWFDSNNCRIVTIDASQPLEEVLTKAKREIWNTYI